MPPSQPTPGVLLVTMAPSPSLTPAQFHDWYNNEHGPGRLRLPFCRNGFRYRATDSNVTGTYGAENPEWMAIYDIEDMDWLTKDVYTRLRQAPVQSQRERDTMAQIKVDRRFWDLAGEWKDPSFPVLEDVQREGEGNVLVSVLSTLQSDPDGTKEAELIKWNEQEHIPLLQKVPGWRRTRRFVTSYLDLESGARKTKQFLSLHEYAPENGLGGPELQTAISTPWTKQIASKTVASKTRRVYDLYYTFGPAPRDLASLSDPSTSPQTSPDALTTTLPAHASPTSSPTIHSYITTHDGIRIPYTLTSSPTTPATAPLLACVNSILTTSSIWSDAITPHFLDAGYRVLTYDARGRSPLPPSSTSPITIETLSSDLVALLDALRAPSAHLVGVSLGGATVLHTALTHPHRVSAFVACDTNSVAPPGNPKAWGERIALAEQESATDAATGDPVVGRALADATVKRWFTPASMAASSDDDDDAAKHLQSRIAEVTNMVSSNSLDGFRRSVNALYAYDFRPLMRGFRGRGAFLVGARDGILPGTMADMAAGLGEEGTVLGVIEGAGHLPMVERPRETAEWVVRFFAGEAGK